MISRRMKLPLLLVSWVGFVGLSEPLARAQWLRGDNHTTVMPGPDGILGNVLAPQTSLAPSGLTQTPQSSGSMIENRESVTPWSNAISSGPMTPATSAASSNLQYSLTAPTSEEIPADTMHLTVDEAIDLALRDNAGLGLAAANVRANTFAMMSARADYFPKISGIAGAFRFNENLGDTLRAGPFGPRKFNIVSQNSEYAGVSLAQPLTQLITVHAGVQLAAADRAIAQAQLEGGQRDLAYAVTQLYFGLLGAQQLRTAAQLQLEVAQSKDHDPEAHIAALQARQQFLQAGGQVQQLQQQLNSLLCLPIHARLELVQPPLPERPIDGLEHAVCQAICCSPEVREAQQGIIKARAGIKVAKMDYVPNVALLGGYLYQDAVEIFDEKNIGYVGFLASYTFVDWGKRRGTLNQRQAQLVMAVRNLKMVEDKIRLAVQQVYRDFDGAWQNVEMSKEILQIRTTMAQQKPDPSTADAAVRAQKEAELELMKAEMNYRLAHARLMSVIGGQGPPSAPNKAS